MTLSPGVLGVRDTTIYDITPLQFYETTNNLFNFTVTTSNKIPTAISLDTIEFFDLKLSNDTDFNDGWDVRIANSTIVWENSSLSGSGASFVIITYLQFYADALNVNSDKNLSWIATMKDNNGKTNIKMFNLKILNDATPPQISYSSPSPVLENDSNGNLNYFKAEQKTITASVEDAETGVKNALFSYHILGFNRSCASDADTANLTLSKVIGSNNSNDYTGQINLSSFNESNVICFTYLTESNGGEISALPGNLTVDNSQPIVALVNPEDNIFITGNLTLAFNIAEPTSPRVSCDIIIDDILNKAIAYQMASNVSAANEIVNVTEGVHTWKIKCADLAGNIFETSVRTVSVDNSPPAVQSLDMPAMVIRGKDTEFKMNISDFSSINEVYGRILFNGTSVNLTGINHNGTYAFVYSPNSNDSLGNYSLLVYAKDGVGFSSTFLQNFTLTYNYDILANINPADPAFGEDITLFGSIKKDDGVLISENEISLVLPDSTIVSVPIDNLTGAFSYQFSAPLTAGNYNLTIQVLSAENGVTYNKFIDFALQDPESANDENLGSSGSSVSGGKSSGKSKSSGSSNGNGESASASSSESLASSGRTVSSISLGRSSSASGESSEGSSEGIGKSNSLGIGKASGFLGDNLFKYSKLVWTSLLVLAVIGALLYFSKGIGISSETAGIKSRNEFRDNLVQTHIKPKSSMNNFKRYEDIGLNDYLNQRLQNEDKKL